MIGYHYTTKSAWEEVQFGGLHPAPIRQHEYDDFVKALPNLSRDAIWVWQEELNDQQALIVLVSLAEIHRGEFDLVLLRVEYDEAIAASVTQGNPGDTVHLTCAFSAGHLNTGRLPIELLIDDVPASDITKIWEVDLLAAVQGRHANEYDLVLA